MTMKQAILLAYEKGYRVTDDGVLIGIKGLPLTVINRGKQRYPTFSVSGLTSVNNKYGVFGIPVHKYAAYCFYGDDVWLSECVRHLDSNVLNISKSNIVLGTNSENNLDKTSEARSNAAKKARAAQGKRPLNSKFSDDQVRYIRLSDKPDLEISKEFNVSKQAIWLIRKRKNYADVV